MWITREYERGGLEVAAVVGEAERGCPPRAGKGEAGVVFAAALGACESGVSVKDARADPVGLMGLTH